MIRLALVATLTLSTLSPQPASAASPGAAPKAVAGDPRVADAVALWQAWVEYQAALDRVPGLSVALVHDRELVAARGFGWANPEARRPATPDTLYSICSISKLFTALALLQLRDQGKLRLDDPVAQHLPWFAIKDVHPDDRPVTVRDLLTHSAGLPRESDFPYWNGPDFPFPTREEVVRRLGEQETLYPSGRYFQYSNLGLTLAGEVVAAASGLDYGEYVRSRILAPLGMADTFTEVPQEQRGGRLALGHGMLTRAGSREVVPPFETRGIAPAAGFASSAQDLARFAMWQLGLLADGSGEVLAAATLREMQRVHWVDPDWKTTWGLGFAVRREDGATLVGHNGACPGYFSSLLLDPKEKVGAVVLANAVGAEVSLYARRAVQLLGPAVAAARDPAKPAPQRDPDLDRYTGVYDDFVWGQEAIVRWQDGLAALWLASRDPAEDLVQLRKVGEHTFRRVRKDDGTLGETFVFEVGADGEVTRFIQHSHWMVKVR